MRQISSQCYLDLRVVALKAGSEAGTRVVTAVCGVLDGEPTVAILNGHHGLMASRWLGSLPDYRILANLPEPEFRAYLRDHRADSDWYDLTDGRCIPSLQTETKD